MVLAIYKGNTHKGNYVMNKKSKSYERNLANPCIEQMNANPFAPIKAKKCYIRTFFLRLEQFLLTKVF